MKAKREKRGNSERSKSNDGDKKVRKWGQRDTSTVTSREVRKRNRMSSLIEAHRKRGRERTPVVWVRKDTRSAHEETSEEWSGFRQEAEGRVTWESRAHGHCLIYRCGWKLKLVAWILSLLSLSLSPSVSMCVSLPFTASRSVLLVFREHFLPFYISPFSSSLPLSLCLSIQVDCVTLQVCTLAESARRSGAMWAGRHEKHKQKQEQ